MTSLRALDLNLLVAFEALYRERSVTKAGRRLGLSQPATSAALARLRAMLGDDLFVTSARGFEPTARAHALAEPVARALEQLRTAIEDDLDFDPQTTAATFRIGAIDAVLGLLLHDLTARVTREAPRASVELRAVDPRDAAELIGRGEIDLAIAVVPSPPVHLETRELFSVPFVIATRVDHPLARSAAPLTLDDLAKYPHVAVTFAGPPRSAVDAALGAAGLERRTAVVLSSFLAVPYALAASDAIAMLPAPFAQKLERDGRLRCHRLPPEIRLPPLRMRLLWSPRTSRSAAWIWMRDLVASIAHP